MMGIYKITNILNGKVYIGQSNNIERRFSEHRYKKESLIGKAMKKYGVENFKFEVLEETENLDEREKFYIKLYNSKEKGYNIQSGGQNDISGEDNPNSKITEEIVISIRKDYNDRIGRKKSYEKYKDKLPFGTFANIWDGSSWSHVMPEVYTESNINYYKKETTLGEKANNAILSDSEVKLIRERYVNETAKEIYKDFSERIKFQTFQQILWGRTYKHLPIYKKKEKRWIGL